MRSINLKENAMRLQVDGCMLFQVKDAKTLEGYFSVVQEAQDQRRQSEHKLEQQMKKLFLALGPDDKGLLPISDTLRYRHGRMVFPF